jgi:hypothetical protein
MRLSKYVNLLFCASLFVSLSFGAEKYGKKNGLQKVQTKEWKYLDGNRINCTINSYGPYGDFLKTNSAGLEWPKGNGTYSLFTAGIWLGGIHRPTGRIRVSNMDYSTEYQPGPITATFNTTTNSDSLFVSNAVNFDKYRLYKISKSDTASPSSNADYYNWPVDLGAPFIDRNGNGTWDPGIDIPKFYGDQQIWVVLNDCYVAEHRALSTSKPLGVEIQALYYCYNQTGSLGDVMFMNWKIMNKSDADYDSLFMGMWSDPDLGDANDDLVGCDTTLSLGYVYNGSNTDSKYGTPPPAAGFDFIQGPKVPGSMTDSAFFDGRKMAGYKNLSASSFVTYTGNTFPSLIDPPDGDSTYIRIAYDYLNGKCGTVHQYLTNSSGKIIKFFFSGDPVAQTGDLPSNFPLGTFVPQDIRMMLNAGPFTLAKGDTQEIVGAFLCAKGTTNLNSITELKTLTQFARQTLGFPSTITGITRSVILPQQFSVEQNYPNPFNPTTTITFHVPSFSMVSVKVFDVLGREVAILLNGQKSVGDYSVQFDASNLSSGVYIYRLQVGSFIDSKKMVLLK